MSLNFRWMDTTLFHPSLFFYKATIIIVTSYSLLWRITWGFLLNEEIRSKSLPINIFWSQKLKLPQSLFHIVYPFTLNSYPEIIDMNVHRLLNLKLDFLTVYYPVLYCWKSCDILSGLRRHFETSVSFADVSFFFYCSCVAVFERWQYYLVH